MQQAITKQQNFPISLGSEFRPPYLLEPLLSWHPFWSKLRDIMEQGVNYKLQPINELVKKEDFKSALEYGHHKSAKRNYKVFMDGLNSEVELGYTLPLLAKHAIAIPQAELAPHGLTFQHSINDRGKILSKDRTTHDLSFPGKASFNSINNRIEDDSLVPCLSGKIMNICIHYIIGCRQMHPKNIIWLAIQDYKSAYRRAHLHPQVSVKTMTPSPVQPLRWSLCFCE